MDNFLRRQKKIRFDIMRKIKIFISSIIEGYLDRRDAVEEAILSLNADQDLSLEAMRMDSNRHPSENKSSQQACLDGVKECDIYIGVFPENDYGWDDSPIGISPTHEEFRQAVKEKKSIIIFIEKKEDKSLRQKEFLQEVGNYVTGRYWSTFESGNLHQLNQLVYRSLLRLARPNLDEYLPYYLLAIKQQLEVIGTPGEIGSISINKIVEPWLRNINSNRDSKIDSTDKKNIIKLNEAIESNTRLFLVGSAGSGKSTSLKWIAYKYAERLLDTPKMGIHKPVFLELKNYNNNLSELITSAFTRCSFKGEYQDLINWFKRGGFIFLLDGLDELDKTLLKSFFGEINILLGYSENNDFVIASRNADNFNEFEPLRFMQVELMQLSDLNIEDFIKIYLGEDNGSKMLFEIKSLNLLDESRNPLLLWFTILEFEEHGIRKLNKTMLFKSVLEDRFLKQWDKKHILNKDNFEVCSNLKMEILSKIAFYMINQNDLTVINEDIANKIIDDFLKEGRPNYKNIRNSILKQLFKSNILIKSDAQLSFWHKSFRDYFASRILLDLYNSPSCSFMKLYATKRWEDSLLFFVGLTENPSQFVDKLVPPFWHYFMKPPSQIMFHLSLAAKCIGINKKICANTQQRLRDQLVRIIKESHLLSSQKNFYYSRILFPILSASNAAICALVEMKSENDVEFLFERLEHMEPETNISDSDFMIGHLDSRTLFARFIVKALKKVPVPLSQEAQNSLLNIALIAEDLYLRTEAKILLRDRMTKETAYMLSNIISNNQDCREIRVKKYVSDLGLVLERHSIREHAIDIFCGDAGDPLIYPDISINPIIKIALEEKNKYLRDRAVSALTNYRDKDKDFRIVEPIIYALHNNPDPIIRLNAAWALSSHPNSQYQFEALVLALEDDNAEVRFMVLHSLIYSWNHGSIDVENRAVNKLFEFIANEDDLIASKSIEVLGFIRKDFSEEELSILVDLLKDERTLIRCRAAELLGNYRAKTSLKELKRLVEAEKFLYPWAYAVRAILRIDPGYSEIIRNNRWENNFIIELSDDDVNKRKTALIVLRCIGTELSLGALKALYADIDNQKRLGINKELFYAIKDIEERIEAK